MRIFLLASLLTASFYLCAQGTANHSPQQDPQFVILFSSPTPEDGSCYRIPALVTAGNGDLIVAVDERVRSCADLRGHRDINIVMRRSSDNGATWSAPETVIDYPPGKPASDPSMIVDKTTGVIFLFFNYMDLDLEPDVYYFKVARSGDHGKTWSEPVDITAQITRPGWARDFRFITSGRGAQTRSGQLIHTLVNLEHGLHLFGSDDHGISWHLFDVPILPGDESKFIELDDGTWMINSRVNGAGVRYVHRSADRGKTWISAPDSALADPGCNASLVRWSPSTGAAGRELLVFSNANHPSERKNLAVKISADEGRTWAAVKSVYAGSAAYSSMTILNSGDIGLVFEKDDYREVAFVRLAKGWLTE